MSGDHDGGGAEYFHSLLREELQPVRDQLNHHQEEFHLLRADNTTLHNDNVTIHAENLALRNTIDRLQVDIAALRSDVARLRECPSRIGVNDKKEATDALAYLVTASAPPEESEVADFLARGADPHALCGTPPQPILHVLVARECVAAVAAVMRNAAAVDFGVLDSAGRTALHLLADATVCRDVINAEKMLDAMIWRMTELPSRGVRADWDRDGAAVLDLAAHHGRLSMLWCQLRKLADFSDQPDRFFRISVELVASDWAKMSERDKSYFLTLAQQAVIKLDEEVSSDEVPQRKRIEKDEAEMREEIKEEKEGAETEQRKEVENLEENDRYCVMREEEEEWTNMKREVAIRHSMESVSSRTEEERRRATRSLFEYITYGSGNPEELKLVELYVAQGAHVTFYVQQRARNVFEKFFAGNDESTALPLLNYVLLRRYWEVALILLRSPHPIDFTVTDIYGWTPLHALASRCPTDRRNIRNSEKMDTATCALLLEAVIDHVERFPSLDKIDWGSVVNIRVPNSTYLYFAAASGWLSTWWSVVKRRHVTFYTEHEGRFDVFCTIEEADWNQMSLEDLQRFRFLPLMHASKAWGALAQQRDRFHDVALRMFQSEPELLECMRCCIDEQAAFPGLPSVIAALSKLCPKPVSPNFRDSGEWSMLHRLLYTLETKEAASSSTIRIRAGDQLAKLFLRWTGIEVRYDDKDLSIITDKRIFEVQKERNIDILLPLPPYPLPE